MTYHRMTIRSGLTAIAAVLALTSTPLLAQEVTSPPDPAPATTSEPAPTADPLAPEPSAAEPAAVEPAVTKTTTTTRKTTTRTQTAAPKRAAAQPVRSATPASPQPPVEQPIGEATAEPLAVPPGPVPPAEPVAAEPAQTTNLMADETLPIAGAAGLGLLALGGIGLAVQRRRRRREEMLHYKANQAYLDEHPDADGMEHQEPAFAKPARPWIAGGTPAAAALANAPRTKLPEGFDLSRFGPHVRAAYLGPTPDNPSVSLKYRLRRAAAMDQMARRQAEQQPNVQQPKPPQPAVHREPIQKPIFASNGTGFMLRRAGGGQARHPAFQK
jgi:hypothetical protein